MCGIIGQTLSGEADLQEALALSAYRGPDAVGYFSDDRVALGHVRLSILDTNERSNQPFVSVDGAAHIIFNGEIYNYRQLRAELARLGHEFRTESDTEVLLEGYRAWGAALLPKLRGMFAFAVYDAKHGKIFLARDHAGIKPLYYGIADKSLHFASELKGVLRLMAKAPHRLSDRSLALYLTLGYIPSPDTLVEGIYKLPRASWLSYDVSTGGHEIGHWEPVEFACESEQALAAAVRASVAEHTIADVPVGVFFSGGVDSSVVALALKEAGINLATYSVLVRGRSADEPYFTAIARLLGVRARVHEFGVREFDETFEHVLSKMDDPIADASIFPTAFISRIAAKDVKVVLSGEGGDELFFGYPRTLTLARMNRSAEPWGITDSFVHAFPAFRGKRALAAALAQGLRAPIAYYLTQASLGFDAAPETGWREARKRMATGDAQWLDRDWYLENMLLRKTDMATMYASLEGRVPLLGAALWRAAPRFALDNAQGQGKTVLRNMLKESLPVELVDRPKAGFGVPLTIFSNESKLLPDAIDQARRGLAGIPILREACEAAAWHTPLAYGLVALHNAIRNLKLL